MNQREVRAQSCLEQEGLAAELHLLFTFLDNCPDAGRREHATRTAAAGSRLAATVLFDQLID